MGLDPLGARLATSAAPRLAGLAVSLGKIHPSMPNFEFAKGLADYRNGNYDAAVR